MDISSLTFSESIEPNDQELIIICWRNLLTMYGVPISINNLTIEKIRAGNSNIRNPIITSFIAKGLLPYRGLGSGVKRALEEWSHIDFVEDREGCLFTVKVRRKVTANLEKMHLYSQKEANKGANIEIKGALKV